MHGKEKQLSAQEIKNNWERFHRLQLYLFRYHLEKFLVGSVALCVLYMMQKLTPNGIISKEMTWAKHSFSYSFLWSDLHFTRLKTWLQFLPERCWDNMYLLLSRGAWPLGSWYILPLLCPTQEPAHLVCSCAHGKGLQQEGLPLLTPRWIQL